MYSFYQWTWCRIIFKVKSFTVLKANDVSCPYPEIFHPLSKQQVSSGFGLLLAAHMHLAPCLFHFSLCILIPWAHKLPSIFFFFIYFILRQHCFLLGKSIHSAHCRYCVASLTPDSHCLDTSNIFSEAIPSWRPPVTLTSNPFVPITVLRLRIYLSRFFWLVNFREAFTKCQVWKCDRSQQR